MDGKVQAVKHRMKAPVRRGFFRSSLFLCASLLPAGRRAVFLGLPPCQVRAHLLQSKHLKDFEERKESE